MTMNQEVASSETEALIVVVEKLLNACAPLLHVSAIRLASAELEGDILRTTLESGRSFACHASAIYTIIEQSFADDENFDVENLFLLEPKKSIFRGFHFGRESLLVLQWVKCLANRGNASEARLCAIQSQLIEDFRKGIVQVRADFIEGVGVGKQLFGNRMLKGEKCLVARSEAAMIERLLPLVADEDDAEALFAADAIVGDIPMALFGIAGKRKASLIEKLEGAQALLGNHRHPALRAYARFFATQMASQSS